MRPLTTVVLLTFGASEAFHHSPRQPLRRPLLSQRRRESSASSPSPPPSLGRRRSALRMSSTVSDISQGIKDMRAEMEQDEQTALMMQALRGTNINDDAAAGVGQKMYVVEMQDTDDSKLPTTYQPERLKAYFGARPGAVLQRIFQVTSTSAGLMAGFAFDYVTGAAEDSEVRRAAQLRDTITSLGPFFIKLGQALSIRPDILSPRAMVELQQLCDKVPSFDSGLAFEIMKSELGVDDVSEVFSAITPEPVAAASLGQVYKATLRESGDEVAVKVQRPFVLETVSLDLHLARELGLLLRRLPTFVTDRIDVVDLIDEFAGRFYQELDYVLECENGVRVAEDMKVLPMVLIPRNYPEWTSRRVHVAQWVEGEKLSQSTADDVGALVNLGVITYLTQLLDTGFFHADPHPGNMLRTPDGKLVILDFGLMTDITDDQKYGMIEAIAHLINRDYSEIGDDFVNLDFIPRGTDTSPIVPALTRVFDAALAGGGAKSINFQELAADLAEITFEYPFRIPPYFALIIRAISVLEGIALVGNPEFAIVDEAYPYISRRLLTDKSPRMREALQYMVYGKSGVFDAERLIDLLQALEKFVAVKEFGDGSAFKVDGVRGSTQLGSGGDFKGTNKVDVESAVKGIGAGADISGSSAGGASGFYELEPTPAPVAPNSLAPAPGPNGGEDESSSSRASAARESLRFLFSDDGVFFREFLLEEIVSGVDALSRDASRSLAVSLGVRGALVPGAIRALAPELTDKDRKVIDNIQRLLAFLLGNSGTDGGSLSLVGGGGGGGAAGAAGSIAEALLQPLASISPSAARLFALSNPNNRADGLGGGSSNPVTGRLGASSPSFSSSPATAAASSSLGSSPDGSRLGQVSADLAPVLAEFAPAMQRFGRQIVGRLLEKLTARLMRYTASEIFGARLEPGADAKDGEATRMPDGRMAASF